MTTLARAMAVMALALSLSGCSHLRVTRGQEQKVASLVNGAGGEAGDIGLEALYMYFLDDPPPGRAHVQVVAWNEHSQMHELIGNYDINNGKYESLLTALSDEVSARRVQGFRRGFLNRLDPSEQELLDEEWATGFRTGREARELSRRPYPVAGGVDREER